MSTARVRSATGTIPSSPSRPIVLRTCKARSAFKRSVRLGKTKSKYSYSIVVTIPAEIARAAGVKIGDTLLFEGYVDGFWVSKGGDLMSAEDATL